MKSEEQRRAEDGFSQFLHPQTFFAPLPGFQLRSCERNPNHLTAKLTPRLKPVHIIKLSKKKPTFELNSRNGTEESAWMGRSDGQFQQYNHMDK